MTLDEAQQAVMDRVMSGASTFITGGAGTGKTLLLNAIIHGLRTAMGSDKVAVAAMTGIAATHISGTSLNAALGLGVPRRYADFLRVTARQKRTMRAWRVLLLDECSMLSAEMLELVEHRLRSARGDPRPAGGLQLVFCGDFYQLPPVCRFSLADVGNQPRDAFLNYGLAFQAPAWARCFPDREHHVALERVYRQADGDFATLLSRVRTGDGAASAIEELLRRCGRPLLGLPPGLLPTQIFALNHWVDELNAAELLALPEPAHVFHARDEVSAGLEDTRRRLLGHEFFRDCQSEASLALRVGAQVMLVRNLDSMHANGSRGVVTGFAPGTGAPIVRFVGGDLMEVAPVTTRLVVDGAGQCKRTQVPLKLAFALTSHKSQGFSLDAVRVSLRGVFAAGQAYVSLSRARTEAGLQVADWDGRIIPADPAVSNFYASGFAPAAPGAWAAFGIARRGKADLRVEDLLCAGPATPFLDAYTPGPP